MASFHSSAPSLASCALALSACGSSRTAASAITLYNGQHEQTTAALVAAFEKQTGIKVNVRTGDEAELGNQIMQEGSSSPADVFYTENTPVLEALREHGLLAPVAAFDARGGAQPLRLRAGRLGRRLRAGVGARLQHLADQARRSCPSSILELAEPEVEGQGRLRPLGDRLPAADHLDRQVRRRSPPPNAG